MKLRSILFVVLVAGSCCFAADLEFFFYNELQADFYNFDQFLQFQETIVSDTIPAYNIFTGRILKNYEGDIFPLAFLNYVNCDLASPTDLRFNIGNTNLDFELLATNILSDSLQITPYRIIETDSMKIGILSIYTPDFAVKYELSTKVELDPRVFAIARSLAEFLAEKTDLVILISSLSKYIDNDLVKGAPIDIVISSDYQEKSDGSLNNSTSFFSLTSKMAKFGRLQIEYLNGEVTYSWSEEPIKLPVQAVPARDKSGETNAAGD